MNTFSIIKLYHFLYLQQHKKITDYQQFKPKIMEKEITQLFENHKII